MSVVGGIFASKSFYGEIGLGVAKRTILRKQVDGRYETWEEVAHRVALGNSLLCEDVGHCAEEYQKLRQHLSSGVLLMSGRHLQHGDADQPQRPMEVFTNCATAATSFLLFLLLLSGSGVGRSYDDDIILVNWDYAPALRVVLSHEHPDFDWSAHESVRDALHKYGSDSKNVMWHKVPDSREGWATALEIWENAAFEKIHKDKLLILDFSDVRARGTAIAGMQNRPASGPVALMNAFMKAASLKGSNLAPWKQALYIDHYFAECVLVGGARRAARMSTKWWKDPGIFDFIEAKRPIEFKGKNVDQVIAYRSDHQPHGFLWSSNNSVTVDDEFWNLLGYRRHHPEYNSELTKHARRVWKTITSCSYGDGTGEPGIINVHKLTSNDEHLDKLALHSFAGSKKFQVREETELLMSKLARRARKKTYHYITNPCSEIVLNVLGGYCTLCDIAPFHADSFSEVEDAIKAAVRALIRVNQMDSLYAAETKRTNRIGVGLTGVHEFAWKFFQVGFRDLINPDFETPIPSELRLNDNPRIRAASFWRWLQRFSQIAVEESDRYSDELGLVRPHTVTTVKPSGTISKLFGLTEGWHLPSMRYYLRWVQFRNDDPLVAEYEANGYPIKRLRQYEGTTVVGFPTVPIITTLGMGDALLTAAEATPEEQYKWLRLGEKYWIDGNGHGRGNQISYTLKYDPALVNPHDFAKMLKNNQWTVRCCSVMPQINDVSYEYVPEEALTKGKYEEVMRKIQEAMVEDVDYAHIECSTGACPIDWKGKDVRLEIVAA